MHTCRMAFALTLLAIAAGSATAQVTDSLASPTKTATAVDQVAIPTPANPQTDAPPAQVSPVPEPASILLVAGPAAVGWVAYWRRKWRADSNSASPAI